MDVRFPPKLRRGDIVRVIAPARSRALVLEHDHSAVINARFAEVGLTLTYGRHVDERNDFDSSSVASRVQDLHQAFADPAVAAIMSVIGGFNSNELLPRRLPQTARVSSQLSELPAVFVGGEAV